MVKIRKFCFPAVAVAGMLLFSGCSDPNITNTSRNAVEQLLLSTAVERGLAQADLSEYAGKKVTLDYSNLAPQVDKNYVQGVMELEIAQAGMIVPADPNESDITLQLICGVLATDNSKILIGTPELPIPLPDTDINIVIPEIALFKKVTRNGYSRFSMNIIDTKTRKPLRTIRNLNAKTQFVNWTIVLIPFVSNDVELAGTNYEDMEVDFVLE